MMHRVKITVRARLVALAAVALVLLSTLGGVSLLASSRSDAAAGSAVDAGTTATTLGKLRTDTLALELALAQSLLAPDTATSQDAAQDFTAARADIATVAKTLHSMTAGTSQQATVDTAAALVTAFADTYAPQVEKLAALDGADTAGITVVMNARSDGEPVLASLATTRDALTTHAAAQASTMTTSSTTGRLIMIVVWILSGAALMTLAWWIIESIRRPLSQMTAALARLARRDLTVQCGIAPGDEIGEMAQAMDTAVAAVRETISTLGESAVTLASASEELAAVSAQVGQAATQTSHEAGSASDSAQEVDATVHTMSAATEQMSASISAIAGEAQSAAGVAAQAVERAAAASQAVGLLDTASQEIGEIVRTITSIAEQTNLLALNATIESARAGDAGKGFAVVAGEVKDLSQETARATDDIAQKIRAIQDTTGHASDAIGEITAVIGQISERQATIAAAVEQQAATTSEIARNVGDVANGSTQISERISTIVQAAGSTSQGAEATGQSAADLALLAVRVRDQIAQFAY